MSDLPPGLSGRGAYRAGRSDASGSPPPRDAPAATAASRPQKSAKGASASPRGRDPALTQESGEIFLLFLQCFIPLARKVAPQPCYRGAPFRPGLSTDRHTATPTRSHLTSQAQRRHAPKHLQKALLPLTAAGVSRRRRPMTRQVGRSPPNTGCRNCFCSGPHSGPLGGSGTMACFHFLSQICNS